MIYGVAFEMGPKNEIHCALTHLPPDKNNRHTANDIFRCISVKEKFCILIKISLKFVPEGPIDNNPTLV